MSRFTDLFSRSGSRLQETGASQANPTTTTTTQGATTRSVPESEWDSTTAGAVRSFDNTYAGTSKPFTQGISCFLVKPNGNVVSLSGRVSGIGKDGIATVRVVVPVSFHVGRVENESDDPGFSRARANAANYADTNRSAVWARTVDQSDQETAFGKHGKQIDTPSMAQLNGTQSMGANGQALAHSIECADNASGTPYRRHMAAVVDVQVKLERGKVTAIMADPGGPGTPGPGSGGVHGWEYRKKLLTWDGT